MEALEVNNEEIKLDEELLLEEMKKIGKNIMFDDNDLVELINGKKINGVKLNKMQKRDIKYMV